MTMKPPALAFACLLAASTAGAADAEIYQWKDGKGQTVMSDKPPSGEVAQSRRVETGSAPSSSAGSPPTKSTADRELEFRKRLKESDEKAEAAKRAETESATRQENCTRAKNQLQVLESGERIGMRDEKGERYFMDDAQRVQEISKTRQIIETSCSK